MELRLFYCTLLLHIFLVPCQFQISLESDSIFSGQTLAGNNTLTSKGGIFEMGFFAPPGNYDNYYIGIWYKELPQLGKTVVWLANRDHPVSDPYSSRLELSNDGRLVLFASSGLAVWSTDSTSSVPPLNSTVAILGDDGNLVIIERSNSNLDKEEKKIWQSFDHPTDTWLPGAKFGYDKDAGIKTVLRSWKDANNPATGLFSIEVHQVLPYFSKVQMLLKSGSDESKFWFYENENDINFAFIYGCSSINYSNSYNMVAYFSRPSSCLVRYVLDTLGNLKQLIRWNGNDFDLTTTLARSPQTHGSHSGNNKDNTAETKGKVGKKNVTWIAIVALALLASLFVGITVLLILARRKDSGSSLEAQGGDTMKQYKHRDLQRATKNFKQKLGEGGFSTVYKGEFADSTCIAVKELKGLIQNEKQLRAELSTLGLLHHKNLVRLRGFCLKGSRRFLVYDYMPNGSLESHLFQRDSNILDWGRRYNIALGIAKGLAYLHEECRDCIIHCDIKPENILLDTEFEPKIADFGLAKLLSRNFSRALTTMRGTRGYLAPEWFSREPVTTKLDVYSYGQVLFEIISGRRNMDLLNNELSSYFPALVLNALNNGGEILTLVDSKLEGEFSVEEVSRACKAACWCIQDHEKDRPTMTQVVQILEGLLDLGIPPIPRFFQSIAETSMNESDIKGSAAYSTSTTLPTSFTFQTPVSFSSTNLFHIIIKRNQAGLKLQGGKLIKLLFSLFN